jgi:hypothetical protein
VINFSGTVKQYVYLEMVQSAIEKARPLATLCGNPQRFPRATTQAEEQDV